MFERILIPLDGSETAEAILPQVMRLLKQHRSEVLLVRVLAVYPPDFHITAPEIQHKAELYIRKKTFELIQDGIPARGFVQVGNAAETILEVAQSLDASLIAMATHGRSGIQRWALGSVTEKVLRASPIPMLLVRSFPPPLKGAISRGRLEELPFRTFVVPLDGSDRANSILPVVKEFGRPVDSKVVLVNVIENDPHNPRWMEPHYPLDGPRQVLANACIPATTDHRMGDAAEEILKACHEHRADLIAMCTHGRTGPSRWVFGSVTEKVLREATVPLLVMHAPKQEPAPNRKETAATNAS